MTAANKYRELEQKLVDGRANGTLSEYEENCILDEMDSLWLDMTEEECEQANARAQNENR